IKETGKYRDSDGCILDDPILILEILFRNSDEYYHDPEKCEHASPKVTTSHGGNTATGMIWRCTVADDLKECSKITQV
ncbi:hypothetical protein Tco_0998690, partial [Tanacetum coccineum]